MPSRLRLNKEELCPYMSFHTLDRVPKSMDETLLAGAPSKGTWSRHTSRSHSEKEWYPSSLSYGKGSLSFIPSFLWAGTLCPAQDRYFTPPPSFSGGIYSYGKVESQFQCLPCTTFLILGGDLMGWVGWEMGKVFFLSLFYRETSK